MKPTTLNECVEALRKLLPDNEIAALQKMRRNELGSLHFDLGAFVRNEMVYENDELLRSLSGDAAYIAIHPDSVSGLIIEELWEQLQS